MRGTICARVKGGMLELLECEVGSGRRHVAKPFIGVPQSHGHGDLDPGIVLQLFVRCGEDIRCWHIHAKNDVQHELGRTALGANDQAVVRCALDETFFDAPRAESLPAACVSWRCPDGSCVRSVTLYAPPASHGALPDSEGIHWYANTTPQQQRAEDKEKLVGLVFR